MAKVFIGILLLIIGHYLYKYAENEGKIFLGVVGSIIFFFGFVIGGLGLASKDSPRK